MNNQDGATPAGWQKALDDLESILGEASRAVAALRASLQDSATVAGEGSARQDAEAAAPPPSAEPTAQDGAPVAPPPPPSADVTPAASPPAPAAAPAADSSPGASAFDRLWDRIENERTEKPVESSEERRGIDSLPQQFLMTVEDREGKVDLVSLHRALADLPSVEETSLVSYANGVPTLSLRVDGELDLDQLGNVVGTAMNRECEVISQDMGRLYLRMKAMGG